MPLRATNLAPGGIEPPRPPFERHGHGGVQAVKIM